MSAERGTSGATTGGGGRSTPKRGSPRGVGSAPDPEQVRLLLLKGLQSSPDPYTLLVAGLLLAIDIGNTNVKLGTFDGEQLCATWRLETDARRMPDEYAVLLDWLLNRRGLTFTDIKGVSLSSTVPAMVPIIKELAATYFTLDCPLVEVSAKSNTGVTIAIDNPSEMGADRIVDALAAAELYRVPAVIVD